MATLQRPFSPSTSVTAGGVGLCITDLLTYARFHLGDGTAANGARVLTRESLAAMQRAQAPKQGTDDSIGIAWHVRRMWPDPHRSPTAARWADTSCCSSSCRSGTSPSPS